MNRIETRIVTARTHGRYFVRPPVGSPRGILIGFHGYQECAETHLAELASIPGAESWALVAVDALHAFYASRSGSGRVVRCWMTRDLREEAIEDNVDYVRRVLESVRIRFGWSLPVVVLGFSQGASMAWRAAVLAGHEVAAAVSLAGDLPPELAALPPMVPYPARALIARGDQDEWYDAGRQRADIERLEQRGVEVSSVRLSGGHCWSDEFRSAVAGWLESIGSRSSTTGLTRNQR